MNVIDGTILLMLCLGAIWGFRNGFVKALLGFIAVGVAVWAGFKFSGLIETLIIDSDFVPLKLIPIVSIAITMILIYLIIILIAQFVTGVIKTVGLGLLNRLGGAFLGILINLIILSATISYLTPFFEEKTITESKSYPLLIKSSELLGANMEFLKTQFKDI